MKKEIKKLALIYGEYFRKSSEAEDRQAQSIPDQMRDTDAVAKREKLTVIKNTPKPLGSIYERTAKLTKELMRTAGAPQPLIISFTTLNDASNPSSFICFICCPSHK
jgi:ribosomal 50S subunit-associated protein YjgA (DUF615 family)